MSEWERLLLPCPIGPIPKITLQFKTKGDPRQAIQAPFHWWEMFISP